MKLSIRSRLMLSFAGVIALVLVCQLVFNLFFAKNYYLTYQERQMYNAYEAITTSFDGTVESIENAASDYEMTNNIEVIAWIDEIVWYTSYDRLLYGSGDHQQNGGAPITMPSVTGQVLPTQQDSLYQMQRGTAPENGMVLENGTVQPEGATRPEDFAAVPENGQEILALPEEDGGYYLDEAGEADVLHFVDAFVYDTQTITIALTLSLESIESSAEVFSTSSMAISFIALVIGLGYSLLLSKSITKPVQEMDQIARRFASLDFSHKANEKVAAAELYHLSRSLNSMSVQLEDAITSLHIANESLQQDIDYQKQMEQMRREFVGNVSHEMKTPLTMLQIYAESLKDNVDAVDKDYYCNTIIEETETLNDLVASMLDISSIESGLSKMQMEELNLSYALSSLVARMQPLLVAHQVECTIQPELVLIGDEKYLEQAMKNYIANAIEHTKAGGRIRIALVKDGDGVRYTVENEGANVEAEIIPRLWDSFYRADKSRSRGNKNVGLGLHIVKTVLDKHAGNCTCENIADGVRFAFWLPV